MVKLVEAAPDQATNVMPHLVKVLWHKDSDVGKAAVETMVKLVIASSHQATRALPEVENALKDKDSHVRKAAL